MSDVSYPATLEPPYTLERQIDHVRAFIKILEDDLEKGIFNGDDTFLKLLNIEKAILISLEFYQSSMEEVSNG